MSTRAEGPAREDGEFCLLADDPWEFAEKVLLLFEEPEKSIAVAPRARAEVVEGWPP